MVVTNTKDRLSKSPTLYENFFSNNDIEIIYKIVDEAIKDGELEGNKYKHFFVNNNGMHILRFSDSRKCQTYLSEPLLMDNLLMALQDKISVFFNEEAVSIGGYFGRYSRDSGFTPMLEPHIDEAKIGENYRMSLTSRLKSTLEWDIMIESDRLKLKENSALFFSSNIHTHWRPQKEFNKNDYYDIMVLHFDFKKYEKYPIDEEYFDKKEKILNDKNLRMWYHSTNQ